MTSFVSLRVSLLCCLLSALARPAAATDKTDLTDFSLEELVQLEVVSASKFSQRASDAPASITVLTAQEFRDYGWRTVADALRSVRSMYITYDRGYSYLGVRGFGRPLDYNSRLLVLVDGYRLNDNVYDQGFIGTELNLDVDLIDRIEIIRGPSSSVYGSSAFFGVANIITKSAAQMNGVEVTGSAGSFDSFTGRLSFARAGDNDTGLLISASGYYSGGERISFSDTGLTTRHTDYLHDQELFAKLHFGNIAIELLHGDRKKGTPGNQFDSVFDDARNALNDTLSIVGMTYDKKLGTVDLSARVTYGHYLYRGDFVYGVPAYASPTLTYDIGRGTWWTAELKGVTTIGDKHRVVAGIEYQHNPQQDQFGQDPFGMLTSDRRSSWRYAIYAQDDFNVTRSVILSAGLRYDSFSNYDASLNPRLGLIWKQNNDTVWKLLYGSAFRTPNVFEAYYNFPGVAEANDKLTPEKINTYEGVLEHKLNEHVRLIATMYHYRLTDLINSVNDSGTGLNQYRNLDSVDVNGMEVEGELELKFGLRARGSYALQVAKADNGDNLTNSPRRIGTLNVSMPVFGSHWRMGFEAQYIGARQTDLSKIDAYTVANLTLGAQDLIKGMTLSLSVYNLFDHRYYDPVELDDLHDLMPQPSRSVLLKATYRF